MKRSRTVTVVVRLIEHDQEGCPAATVKVDAYEVPESWNTEVELAHGVMTEAIEAMQTKRETREARL